MDKLIDIQDIPSNKIKNYTKVFLNGEWLGLTDQPRRLYNFLKRKKLNGEIDIHNSIIHEIKSEIESKELKIYCDGGRMFRPVFRVENNDLLIKKMHADMISLEDHDSATKLTSWNQFMMKNPGLIEYIDTDEQYNAMIAMFPEDIEKMRHRMIDSAKMINKIKVGDYHTVANRYDDFVYVRYTHAEIHPSMHLGLVASNIPFCNANQAPRNIFQYSQARQAMGIYTTNYRDRLDISYILYHPQRPLITTRSMKYIGTDILPSGENAVVAIATYTG